MEITGIIQNTQAPKQTSTDMSAAIKHAEMPPLKRSDVMNEPVQIAAVEQIDLKRTDEKRMDDIRKTIQRGNFKDVFAVRDNSFTIFKDTSGQYITRFTSLRDGSVTYVPEPEILKYSGGSEIYFQVSV
jgi:hypothetical protein